MPQHRRSIAFSTKKKKEQLQAKRAKKRNLHNEENSLNEAKPHSFITQNLHSEMTLFDEVEELNASTSNRNRYCLKFKKENKVATQKKSKLHHSPLKVNAEDYFHDATCDTFFIEGLDFPKRPPWTPTMTKDELEQNENKSFRLFCEDIDKRYRSKNLSLYELNLETWRQLWRVIEKSDILLFIVDIRFPVAQFPPYLYEYLIKEGKKSILILNKSDLVPPTLVLAWQDFFIDLYPELIVLPFTSAKKSFSLTAWKVSQECLLELVHACEKLAENKVDFEGWKEEIGHESEGESDVVRFDLSEDSSVDIDRNVLTVGTIGHPNVGKSSLINSLIGKKVVSVSKTPGHTKHFQTIFITKTVRLCDCPGLVFPSICPKELQILSGSYPISQVKDPISCVHYIGKRLNIPQLLRLDRDHLMQNGEVEWTPFLVCEAWAKKRGYFTRTKGGKPDSSRAANEILRFTLVGHKSLVFSLQPPNYSNNKGSYESDPRLEELHRILRRSVSDNSSSEESEGEGISESTQDDVEGDTQICGVSNKFALLDCDN